MNKKRQRILCGIMAIFFVLSTCLSTICSSKRIASCLAVEAADTETSTEAVSDQKEDAEENDDVTEEDEEIEKKEVFVIRDEDDFMLFTENCRLDEWSLHREIQLKADLDLSGSMYSDFDGISSFSGDFNGNNYTITGIRLTGGTEAVGMFHYLEQEGCIRDLNVNINMSSDNSAEILGGIVGVNSGTIRNSSFLGNISGNGTTGGIAGYNGSTGMIEECKVSGTIKSSHSVGGVVGENRGIVSDSENHAEVNSDSTWFEEDDNSSVAMSISGLIDTGTELILNGTDIGGIAGYSDGIIAGCKNSSTVGYLHTGRNIGGIVGRQSGDVINCTNSGSVYGKQDVGGIVGLMEPALTYEDAEKLNEEVDGLHDDIDTLISDMDALGDSVHSDLNDLSTHADNASDTVSAMTTELRDVVETDVDVINDLSSRLTYVVNHMPDVMDYMDSALNSMEDLGKDFSKLQEDVDIEAKMENETYDPAKEHRLTLLSGVGGTLSADNMNPSENTEVTVTIQAEDGYALSKLTYKTYQGTEQDVTSDGKSYTFTMPEENVTISATFVPSASYIARSNAGGRLDIKNGDTKVTLQAVAYAGYDLDKVTLGGTDITGSFTTNAGIATCELDKEVGSEPVIVEATFVKTAASHTILVESSTGGTVTTDPAAAAAGDSVTITSAALRNYTLNALTVVDPSGNVYPTVPDGENRYQFTMPDSRVTVKAEYNYVPDANTKVYAESAIGGVVEVIPNPTNNDYYITMTAASGYEISSSGVVLEIYENGNATPVKQLTKDELEVTSGTCRYTLNSMNYANPVKVIGYFTETAGADHTVTVTTGTGGYVAAEPIRVAAGDEIKIAVSNEDNYCLQSLTVNGEEISDKVTDGTVTWKVPASITGDIEIIGTFSPVLLIMTSTGVGGNAEYKVSGDTVTITVTTNTGYTLQEPISLKEKDGTDILYQKQYANSNIYSFRATDSMKKGNAAYLELEFLQMDDKTTVENAKNQILEDSDNFSESLSQVSSSIKKIEDLMTDEYGDVRSAQDLSEEELNTLQQLLLDLSVQLSESATYASSVLHSLNTIVDITAPYVEEAINALQEDLTKINQDYQTMVEAFQGAGKEARAIVDYLNALSELKFKNLSSNFDSNSEKLSAELDTILVIMRRLNDHVDLYSDKIETDMRAVNDRLNVIFDMILIRMDNLENMSDGKDILEDHSADEELIYDTSRITSCKNSGKINGDTNIGGITGSIGREADENNSTTDNTSKFGAKYIVCAIIQGCNNEGFIRVKTENGGGIAGNMSVGLISNSNSAGSVASSEGKCLGGIAGYSTGTIQGCNSKTELSGNEYIGGIAGKASAISDSISMACITNSVARVGAIAAEYLPNENASDDMTVYRRNLKTDYRNNYYVSSVLYGIDGVSYASVAEPITYSQLMQMDGVDGSFKSMEILFLDEDDNVVDRVKTHYGASLSNIGFPQIQTDDGDYYEWSGPETDLVENNMVFRAVVTANVTVLQSIQKLNGKSYALAEGVYTEAAKMQVVDSDLEVPGGLSSNTITHVEHVTIENSNLRAEDQTKLRLLKIEEGDCDVYVYRDDKWKKLDCVDAGNYVQVTMLGTDETFCLATNQKMYVMEHIVLTVAFVSGSGALIILLPVIAFRKWRKGRKAKKE